MEMDAGILTLAVQKLSDFIIQEANFLLGVKDDLEWIERELICMQCFLKDAEQIQGTDERIRQWVDDIRYIALKIENIMDAYNAEVKGREPSKRKLLNTFLRKNFRSAGETNVYDIDNEIKELRERLFDISRKREVYGINNIGSTQEIANLGSQNQLLRDLRRTTSHVDDEEHFVGFDDDILLLKEKLLSNEQGRSLISIYGMDGLGKTSLARKLYNTINCRFERHAWVSVSQEWNTRDLLEKIIKTLKEPLSRKLLKNWNEDDMKRHLLELLKDKRYLVVIDDMWDKEALEYLRSDLPDNRNRSRVIITTRSKLVAELSDERTYVHKLRRLQEDESWKLFCKIAFPNRNSACPEDLEEIGKEMVARCDGLPLAIIVLGGLLSRKHSNDEWRVIRKRIWRALIDKFVHITALLELSYSDLSRELKSCFLYLGIFPEDYAIDTRKLVKAWIAKKLIPPSEGQNLEVLAESYIKELNARSLIQLIKNEYASDSTYCVHDLVRDLAVKKAKELGDSPIYDEYVNQDIMPFSRRRIAFRRGFEKYYMVSERRDDGGKKMAVFYAGVPLLIKLLMILKRSQLKG